MNAYQNSQIADNNSIQGRKEIVNPMFSRDLQGIGTFGPVEGRAPAVPRREGNALLEHYEQEMQIFQYEHEAAIEEVRRCFVLPADASVITFLHEHKTLPQILLEAIGHLRRSFGADTIFALTAPTDEVGSRTLYAVVIWPGAVQDVRRALQVFDETWWFAHSRQASGHLTFTYELV